MSYDNKSKPVPPEKPTGPPVRRVVNEKVINRKEIDEWSNTRKNK